MSKSLSDMLLEFILLLTIIVLVKSRPDVPITQAQTNLSQAIYRTESEGNSGQVAILGGNTLTQVAENSKNIIDLNKSAGLKEHTKDPFDERVQQRVPFLGFFWNIQNITYKVFNFPTYLKKTDVDIEISRALATWSEVTNLTFTPKDAGEVDIRIEFLAKDHGDFRPFYGLNGAVAHANTTEEGAYVHFDNDEYWTINSTKTNNSTDLFHSTSVDFSVMSGYYNGYEPNRKLGKFDIEGIQYLYGSKSSPSINGPFSDFAVPRSTKTFLEFLDNIPFFIDLCADPKIDAVFNSVDNQTYIFKSNKYYKLSRYSAAGDYPKLISDGWPGLPGDIDAAFEYNDGKIYFFKGTKLWRYNGSQLDEGYPKEISEDFPGIPDDLDTALVWDDGVQIYFFKGNKYWSFDSSKEPSVKSNYIRSYSNWKFLPMNLDAAFLDFDGFTYFFKNNNFYQIDAKKIAIVQKIKKLTKLKRYSISLTNSCIVGLYDKWMNENANEVNVNMK